MNPSRTALLSLLGAVLFFALPLHASLSDSSALAKAKGIWGPTAMIGQTRPLGATYWTKQVGCWRGGGFTIAGSGKNTWDAAFAAVDMTVNGTALFSCAAPDLPYTIILAWEKNPEPEVVGYNVYRSTERGVYVGRMNATPLTGLTFSDATLQRGPIYFYVVKAVLGDGTESFPSNEIGISKPFSAELP